MIVSQIMLRRYGAEYIGTFAYVFFGCGVKILQGGEHNAGNSLLLYLTFGFTLFIMTYALSHLSGAPFNPAITFGLACTRRFPWRYVLPYWISQIVGALSASLVLALLFPRQASTATYGATLPHIDAGRAVIIEALITFFFMLVCMSTTTDRRVNRGVVGLATGLTITLTGLFAGPLTGGSLNPARSLAPALLAGGAALNSVWIYWLGPLAGALLGAFVYELLRGGQEYAQETPTGIFTSLR